LLPRLRLFAVVLRDYCVVRYQLLPLIITPLPAPFGHRCRLFVWLAGCVCSLRFVTLIYVDDLILVADVTFFVDLFGCTDVVDAVCRLLLPCCVVVERCYVTCSVALLLFALFLFTVTTFDYVGSLPFALRVYVGLLFVRCSFARSITVHVLCYVLLLCSPFGLIYSSITLSLLDCSVVITLLLLTDARCCSLLLFIVYVLTYGVAIVRGVHLCCCFVYYVSPLWLVLLLLRCSFLFALHVALLLLLLLFLFVVRLLTLFMVVCC